MPAAKPRNRLPSTSSTIAPRPDLATRGWSRVNEGDIYFASRSTMLFALGPGRAVRSRGVFVSVAVIMESSKLSANLLIGQRLLWCRDRRADFFRAQTDLSPAGSANWRVINLRRRDLGALRREKRS